MQLIENRRSAESGIKAGPSHSSSSSSFSSKAVSFQKHTPPKAPVSFSSATRKTNVGAAKPSTKKAPQVVVRLNEEQQRQLQELEGLDEIIAREQRQLELLMMQQLEEEEFASANAASTSAKDAKKGKNSGKAKKKTAMVAGPASAPTSPPDPAVTRRLLVEFLDQREHDEQANRGGGSSSHADQLNARLVTAPQHVAARLEKRAREALAEKESSESKIKNMSSPEKKALLVEQRRVCCELIQQVCFANGNSPCGSE